MFLYKRFFCLLLTLVFCASIFINPLLGYAQATPDPEIQEGEPQILTISPNVLIPMQTEITITGANFGDSYLATQNEVCFNNWCILDQYINEYLISWSDTEIHIMAPEFLTELTGNIYLKLYSPADEIFKYIESPEYSLQAAPFITWYYTVLLVNNTYIIKGENFGTEPGQLLISGVEAQILEWSDSQVEFKVPLSAKTGPLIIKNSDGIQSSNIVLVTVISENVLSDDPYTYHQWYLKQIKADQAWEVTEGSDSIIVAVIDTGVDINHEDIKDNIWLNEDEIANNKKDDDNNGFIDDVNGWDFHLESNLMVDRGNHGTGVAGLIAALKDNQIGIAGVAPNVKIMPLNISLEDGINISVDAANKAIKYAVDNGAQIINLSFGGTYNNYYDELLQYAYDNNVLVIGASGNENVSLNTLQKSPVCNDLESNLIIGVTALDEDNKKAEFANYGSLCTDISAPGDEMILALMNNRYGISSGTSFSTPLVSGVAALLKSKNPSWNVEEIKTVLLESVINIDSNNSSYSGQLGGGLIDAYKAINAEKPEAAYTYNPGEEIEIEETNIVISLEEEPIPEPITDTEDVEEGTSPFTDTEGHKFEEAIAFVKDEGIVDGYIDGTYKPDLEINRAEFTKIIMNAFEEIGSGTKCFPDVNEEWYANFVCGAKNLGIIAGYPDGLFKPDQKINFVEALKIVLETSGRVIDHNVEGDWYMPYVNYADTNGLLEILDYVKNSDLITRGEMAEIIYWMLN